MAKAEGESTELRRFKTYRDGLLIATLAARQLRLGNLTGLTLGRTLVQQGDGWWIQIPAAETKTKDPIEEPWPEMLVPHLETYLTDHRAGIVALRGSDSGALGDALWLSMHGLPMNDNAIYIRIVARTREGLGQAINPHLFRVCAATSIAIDDPEVVRTSGKTHHCACRRIRGVAAYVRVKAPLASGLEAWVYVDARGRPPNWARTLRPAPIGHKW